MTLESYDPDRLDGVALRLLDLCTQVRSMACRARTADLPALELNDKKALEWLGRLEEWTRKSEADLEFALLKRRGQQRAMEHK